MTSRSEFAAHVTDTGLVVFEDRKAFDAHAKTLVGQ
jgi:hypothetical protein